MFICVDNFVDKLQTKGLIKGLLKINNFRTSDNKLGYLYVLTPKGLEVRRKLTLLYLQRKSEEFDKLTKEMERIKNL